MKSKLILIAFSKRAQESLCGLNICKKYSHVGEGMQGSLKFHTCCCINVTNTAGSAELKSLLRQNTWNLMLPGVLSQRFFLRHCYLHCSSN